MRRAPRPGRPGPPTTAPPPAAPPGPAGPRLLEARGLCQRLRGRAVLRECTFSLRPGVTALLGPNGAGKSVLLRTMAGVLRPTEGGVWLDGRPASLRRLHQTVAYVAQFPGVHPWLSVRGHLERAAIWSGAPGARAAADAAVERFGLSGHAHRPGGRVPLAVRRRMAVAEAWVRRCRVLLLDEPTADLNPEERAAFWAEMAQLGGRDGAAQGVPEALLVTTHLLDEVESHCRWALLLAAGRVRFAAGVPALAGRAAGRCFRLPKGAEVPPGWLVVGVAADGGQAALVRSPEPPPESGDGVPPSNPQPPGSAGLPAVADPRAPTVLDGYLHLVGVGGA